MISLPNPSKSRKRQPLPTMKIVLLIALTTLFVASPDARTFTADQLNNLEELVRPNNNKFSISY